MSSILTLVFERLYDHFGPQSWWPGETQLEVMAGAVLTQNTSWSNVQRAIARLHQAQAMSVECLHRMPVEELAELIRSAGYYRLKAVRLKNLMRFVWDRYGGALDTMFATDLEILRPQLLSVNGIGPETADAILLYAGRMPTFVVDAYTARIGKRHGWLPPEADYHQIKEYFEFELPRDEQLFNEYHALLVRVGKEHCFKRNPDCKSCPLRVWLPDGVPPEF
jgi:endonuclease-3 related protein